MQKRIFTLFLFFFFLISFASACTTMGAKSFSVTELKKKYPCAKSRFIDIDGVKVHYADEGEGPVLLLLHGVCASLYTWDGWVKELKGHYRIIRFDNVGFGLTGPAKKPVYTIDNYVKFLHKFVTAMKLEKFSLVGNSLGGYISWNYCLAHPERLEKLILIDSAGYNMEAPWLMKLATFPLMRPIVRRMMPRYFLNKALAEVYGDEKRLTTRNRNLYFDMAMREGNKSAWVDIFVEMMKEAKNPRLSRRIKDIGVPTLVMWGRKDAWIPVSHVKCWKKDLPEARYIIYDGVGHIGMEEIPVQTARDARAFFEGKINN